MVLDRLTSTLFATRLHAAATIVGGVVVLVAVAVLLGVVGAPGVEGVESRFGDVNETTTAVESDLVVDNPNPVGVRLGGTTVDYAISMNGIRMAEGAREGVDLESGRSTIGLTTYLDNRQIPAWWASHVRNGEQTTVAVHADVHSSLLGASFGAPTIEEEIETDVTSGLNSTETRPIDAGAPLVDDPVLYVNETSATWGNVTDAETSMEMTFTVYNPKSYPISMSELGYDVTMNDVDVGDGASDRSVVLEPGEAETVEATTVIRNDALDDWWVSHLERNQVTELTIDLYARIDLTDAGASSVEVPLDNTTQTVETDVFETKAESGTVDEEASGSGEATPTDGTDGETNGDGEAGTGGDETETPGEGTRVPTDSPTDSPLDDPLETLAATADTSPDDSLAYGGTRERSRSNGPSPRRPAATSRGST